MMVNFLTIFHHTFCCGPCFANEYDDTVTCPYNSIPMANCGQFSMQILQTCLFEKFSHCRGEEVGCTSEKLSLSHQNGNISSIAKINSHEWCTETDHLPKRHLTSYFFDILYPRLIKSQSGPFEMGQPCFWLTWDWHLFHRNMFCFPRHWDSVFISWKCFRFIWHWELGLS